MIKQAPSPGHILVMVAFSLSVFGLLTYLWLTFGGPIPLKPEGYRVNVRFPEAATLAGEADVRISGVAVGRVKEPRLAKEVARLSVELELEDDYAPIPADTRAILRQKTLLGETYVELTPGDRSGPRLPDGARLPDGRVEPAVQIDEIYSAFDEPTRDAFGRFTRSSARVLAGGRDTDLNDALGNLPGAVGEGATLLDVLDAQGDALRGVVRNTGAVLGAVNEQEGALRETVRGTGRTFEALAARDEALAATVAILPTFLEESRATFGALEQLSHDARPLVRDLRPAARDLAPTARDLGDLAPDATDLLRDLDALRAASRDTLPALERVLAGLRPVTRTLHPFLGELNPIVSYLNFHQATVAGFIHQGGANLAAKPGGERAQTQVGIIEERSFEKYYERQDWERGNAYVQPNAFARAVALGTLEAFDCAPAGGIVRDPEDAEELPPPFKGRAKRLPCFEAPPSLYDGGVFVIPGAGRAPAVDPPHVLEGTAPADPGRAPVDAGG